MSKYPQLTTTEINLVLNKIRSRYDSYIKDFKKSNSLKEAFEERYILTLRMKKNLTAFLYAEIEAVEEIYKREKAKQDDFENERKRKTGKSFADKTLEENRKRFMKYEPVKIDTDVEEEILYLCGGIREFINRHMSVAVIIGKHSGSSIAESALNKAYNNLLLNIDYKGEIPLARHYTDAIRNNLSVNRILFEYQKFIQDCGFLLNDTISLLKKGHESISSGKDSGKQISFIPDYSGIKNPDIRKIYDGKTRQEGIVTAITFLSNLIADFRLRDIKKN